MKTFGKILRELRIEKNLTQKDMATLLSITIPTLSHWECDYQEPSFKDLIILSNFFNCSVDHLLGREDDLGNVVLHSDPADILTKDEKRLIAVYRKLVPNMKTFLLSNAEMLAAQTDKR